MFATPFSRWTNPGLCGYGFFFVILSQAINYIEISVFFPRPSWNRSIWFSTKISEKSLKPFLWHTIFLMYFYISYKLIAKEIFFGTINCIAWGGYEVCIRSRSKRHVLSWIGFVLNEKLCNLLVNSIDRYGVSVFITVGFVSWRWTQTVFWMQTVFRFEK